MDWFFINMYLLLVFFEVYLDEKGEIKIWKHGVYEHCIYYQAHRNRVKVMKKVEYQGGSFLVTADSSGEIRVWDILMFL